MKKMLLFVALSFFTLTSVNAQEKTKEELKAEREQLKSEQKSDEYKDRQKKLQDLADEAPSSVGVSSIDNLAKNSTNSLTSTMATNKLLPELYKRTIGDPVDGVTDVTVKKPTPEELLQVSANIATTTLSVAGSGKDIIAAQGDVKSAGLKAGKAAKSVNYSKDVNTLLASELKYQGKLINNLIATLKSANNK